MINKEPYIVVVGTSAGGMEALKKLVSQLPCDFPGAIFIVWHIAPAYPSVLPQILDRVCPLPVAHAIDNEAIQPSRIYVAPPDHHLLIESEHIRVTKGPKENRFRPSIDVLFRSAARYYGNKVIGVVLTGLLDDGASGLYSVKELGGKAIVQDPFDALHASMPIEAMKTVEVDHCLPVAKIGALLVDLTNSAVKKEGGHQVSEQLDIEVKVALEKNAFEIGIMKLGKPSPFTCPECHGILLQLKEGKRIRFRCHTGHAYSLNSLLVEVTEGIEASLWKTLRGIEESEMLLSQMAKHLGETDDSEIAERFLQKSTEAKMRADLVKQALMSHETLSQEKVCNALEEGQ